jgi:SAM-dependent methyltransferase
MTLAETAAVHATDCPICAAPRRLAVPFDRRPDMEAFRREIGDSAPYAWFLCERCGNAAPNRQPDRRVLARYWDTDRDPRAGEDTDAAWAERRRIAEIGAERSFRHFAKLHRGPAPGRFLDVACGLGVTVRHFADRGWTAEGIDTDRTLEPAHRRLGIAARIGQVEDHAWEEPFDLIQVAYAIYFITDPMAFLRRLRGMLSPGGHLGIVLADFLAYTQASGPSYAHTWLPTQESLEQALALAGFRVFETASISGSIFMAATPGAAAPPAPPVRAILWRHRTRAWRWRMLGAPRQALARVVRRHLRR